MQKTRKKLVNCKTITILSDVFIRLKRKIKTALKLSTHKVVVLKQKSEDN